MMAEKLRKTRWRLPKQNGGLGLIKQDGGLGLGLIKQDGRLGLLFMSYDVT